MLKREPLYHGILFSILNMKSNNEIVLEKFSEKYITDTYLKWLNDKNLMRFSENRHINHTKQSCKKYLQSFCNSNNKLYAILDKSNNKIHVGNITSYIDKKNLTADIGVLIGISGMGYGYKAWMLMMNKLFLEHGIRKITGGAMFTNKAMIKIFIKSGMKLEYIKKKQFISDGSYVDLVGYSIFKDNII